MKLKKLIEKAKQQRREPQTKAGQEALSPKKSEFKPDHLNAENLSSEMHVNEERREFHREDPNQYKNTTQLDWISPVYSVSKAVELDLEALARNRCICLFPDSPEAEFYKVLRTNIQHRVRQNQWNTIMITSAQPKEGKTLTAINLALTFAKEFDQTVLLVDCDLRRQSIHRYLNLSLDKGIVDYLLNGCSLKDLIVWPNIEKFTLISGGKTIGNSVELLGSPRMKTLVQELKHCYDDRFIIFDTPPVLGWADAITFAPLVDCILMVVQEGRTSIQDVAKAIEMLPAEKFLGFVLNRRKSPMQKYYY
jgi:non-specific protein-tyrosine kinase